MSFTKTFAEDRKERARQIARLIDATYDSGYYAAMMQYAHLTEAKRDEYAELYGDAIARRKAAREALEL